MRDINNADFRFAKTLTLPFFGSGMVDLPPGGVKRVKNSRKMQMVFFVFYGRVTVDLGTPMTGFSIGKGGMWQVPRGESETFYLLHIHFQYAFPGNEVAKTLEIVGADSFSPDIIGNFYSISNNSTTHPARIFFAQGCEVAAEPSADESVVG